MFYQQITKKSLISLLLLYCYFGGCAFYWGSMQVDLFAIVVMSFLLSHFLGTYITLGYILADGFVHRFPNRYLRLVIDFILNFIVVYVLLAGNQYFYETGTWPYIFNPITFGLLYGVIYLIPYSFTLIWVERKGDI